MHRGTKLKCNLSLQLQHLGQCVVIKVQMLLCFWETWLKHYYNYYDAHLHG